MVPFARLLIVLLLATASWPARAAACRCAPQSLEEYHRNADIVFLAEIVSVSSTDGGPGFRNARPRIVEAFKGADGIESVRTATSSAACGVDIESGERYWIFAQRRVGEPVAWIDSCSGSRSAGADFTDVEASQVASRLRALSAAEPETVAPGPYTKPACWGARRRYHTGAPPAAMAQKITLERTDGKRPDVSGVMSPNGAYAFEVENPTSVQRPPRVATVTVEVERDYRLTLRLHGVAEPVQAEWVNEKLVFVRAAWSPSVFVDVILDVEAEELIYAEAAAAGEILFQENRGPCIPD